MKFLFFIFTCLISFFCWSQALVINELDPDSPSTDTKEFIELKSQTPNFSTNGYIIVLFNGSNNGGDSSYINIDLNGYSTDNNGLLVIGSEGLNPFPQLIISESVIQNGPDAIGIYQASISDFPVGTLATQTNLIDAMVYSNNNTIDNDLLALLGETTQYKDDGTDANPKSIQRFLDGSNMESYTTATPTPRRENDGSGIAINPITISTQNAAYNEDETFDIIFTSETNVASNLNFTISITNANFTTADYTGNLNLTIPIGQNTATTTVTLIDDTDDEGDEVAKIKFLDLVEPIVAFNNNLEVRIVDNDFTTSAWGTPLSPTTNMVQSTQPTGYYDSLDNLAGTDLTDAIQNIIANPAVVRAQTYADVIDILNEADQNPENSNEVWLVYSEEGRPKLDIQTGSSSAGKWNREHTFPRSRGGFNSIDADDFADGIDNFWVTRADSLRHGNSDAHALRAADASENSSRGNKHYGDYNGPTGNLGSFKGDVARSVLYMQMRYIGLSIVNGFPTTTGQLGDLNTLLDWHRNDPPDDFEMNRNNIIYNWQRNRNPFIDQPLMVEYIWGTNVGDTWMQSLSTQDQSKIYFTMYPNPTENKLYFSSAELPSNIEVYSVDGKLLKTYTSAGSYIDLEVASGIYLLKFTLNNTTLIKKVLVK